MFAEKNTYSTVYNMPYNNKYNAQIASAMNAINQTHVNAENTINDNPPANDTTSQLESMVLKNPEVVGGNGYAAATVQDLGTEPTMGQNRQPSRRGNKKKLCCRCTCWWWSPWMS